MQKYILTTGPALANEVPLAQVHSDKNIYRINGAHGTISDIEAGIKNIRRQVPGAVILMDLPGNKVRTAHIEVGIQLEKGKTFELRNNQFNYPDFYRHLKPGMTAWANDSASDLDKNTILSLTACLNLRWSPLTAKELCFCPNQTGY